jgi:hypothetical protein
VASSNVLRVNEVEEQTAYRRAVARIIDDIQRFEERDGKSLGLVDIAEDIGVSLGTVSNASLQKTDLSPTYLTRLGKRYGAGYLNPYFALVDAQAAPLENTLTSDILPMVMAVAHKIACARDPAGPGGVVEVPQEKAGYLPDLKRLNQRSGCLIQEIEAVV